jgi:hypothetical protein
MAHFTPLRAFRNANAIFGVVEVARNVAVLDRRDWTVAERQPQPAHRLRIPLLALNLLMARNQFP